MTMLVLYATLALGVSFLCSLLEASLLSLPRSQVESMVAEGSRVGRAMKKLKDNIDRPLAAILTLNTVAHTVGAAGVGAEATHLFGEAWIGVVSGLMTLAILIFSEIIPKSIGARNARALAGATSWIANAMITLCYPIILGLEQINKRFGLEKHGDHIDRMEVLATIRLGHQGGELAVREHRTMMNLMTMSKIKVSEVLTPRTVIFALPAATTVNEAIQNNQPLQFARIPIYEASIDDAQRYITRYDLMQALSAGKGDEPLRVFSRALPAIPEQASVSDLLDFLLNKHEHMTLVVDEHGGVEGLATLEDAFETLLGEEIIDETDPAPDMRILARRRAVKRGTPLLDRDESEDQPAK